METISGIFEGRRVACVGEHPRGEILHRDVDAKSITFPTKLAETLQPSRWSNLQ